MKRVHIKLLFPGNALRGCPLTPQAFKPNRSGPGVDLGMCNIAVPQIVLNRPRIAPFIGQREPATVSGHMGMNVDAQPGALADLSTDVVESLSCHRAAL